MASLVSKCVRALLEKKWTIAFVESASAGKMCYAFATVPDSGQIVLGGMVCYHQCMKEESLGIPHDLIERHTAESAEVTRAMATHFRQRTPSDVVVALTGLTTPGGSETPEKPVGTIFIHILVKEMPIARRFEFKGTPDAIVDQAIEAAASMVLEALSHREPASVH